MEKSVRHHHFVDYIRQLSIVALGIVITFIGSAVIDQIRERSEIKKSLNLVKEELISNVETIKEAKLGIKKDVSVSKFMFRMKDSLSTIDSDS